MLLLLTLQGAAGNQSRLQSLGKLCALLEAACPCPAVNDAGNDARLVAAVQYVAAVRQLLGMQLASLSDMPERIKFCKQRLDKVREGACIEYAHLHMQLCLHVSMVYDGQP